MAHLLRFDAEAERNLRALPPALRLHVARELRRLAASPATLSRPAAFPHPLQGQLFDIKFVEPSTEHFVTVMFRYHSDEQHIDVAWITHLQRPHPGPRSEDLSDDPPDDVG